MTARSADGTDESSGGGEGSDLPALEELVRAAMGGDRDAFGRLYRAHEAMVHGVLLATVGPGRALDMVQEVFLKALRSLDRLEDPLRFGAWLRTIARNAARDVLRGRRDTARSLEVEPSVVDSPRLEAEEVLRVLLTLPEAYREPLTLRLVEGLTGPEIAAQTGLTKGSVRVNLHRGMKLFRERLGLAPIEGEGA